MTDVLKFIDSCLGHIKEIRIDFLSAIAVALGLILFLPEEMAKTIFVDEVRTKYGVFLGPTFLITVSFLGGRLIDMGVKKYKGWQNLKAMHQHLHDLTPEEKGYLVPYIYDQVNTVHARLDDGIMGGLSAKKITGLVCRVGYYNAPVPFNLHPWARKYLEKNPHLLDGHKGKPTSLSGENSWMAM